MSGTSVEQIETFPGSTRLDQIVRAGESLVRLRVVPEPGLVSAKCWLVLDPFGPHCELQQAIASDSRDITLSGSCVYQHEIGEPVLWVLDQRVNLLWFGSDQAAFDKAVSAAIGMRGKLYIPAGTYDAQLDLSNLGGNTPLVVEGDGYYSVIRSASGVVLDLGGSSRLTVRDLEIQALAGAEIGILACRYTGSGTGYGSGLRIERVRVKGAPSVAGIFAIGAEVSVWDQVEVNVTGAGPCMIVGSTNLYGPSNQAYVSPHGTILSPSSQFVSSFLRCAFIKDDALTTITGPAVEIVGSNVNILEFTGCYFHAPEDYEGVRIDSHGLTATLYNLVFRNCGFESNYVAAGHGSHGIKSALTGGGSLTIQNFSVENCFFYQRRYAPGWYDIDFGTAVMVVQDASIKGNKCAWGGGVKLGSVYGGYIQWQGVSWLTAQAISAGSNALVMASGHNLQVGDWIRVGKSIRNDGASGSFTQGEDRQVSTVSGNSVTVTPAFTYAHPTGDSVLYSLPEIGLVAGATIETFGMPVITSNLGAEIVVRGIDQNYRKYFGPQAGSSVYKQSPVLVNRPFSDEPGKPESGMLVGVSAGGAWETTTDLDGWSGAGFPAWYAGRWYALPMAIQASAAWTPGAIAAGGYVTVNVTVTGAVLGDFAVASYTPALGSTLLISAAVISTNSVRVSIANHAASPVTPTAGTVYVIVLKR